MISTQRYIAVSEYLAVCLCGIILIPCVLFICLLYGNVTGEIKWLIPIIAGILTPFFAIILLKPYSSRLQLSALALLIILIMTAFLVASLFYDLTWDSRAYHSDAILLLLAGNNPFYESMHGFDDLWTNHYPKITWYFAAVLIHSLGNYNLGKSYHLILLFAVFFYLFAWLKQRNSSTAKAVLVALAITLNPVAMSQLHSFYVDGALACLFTLALFSHFSLFSGCRRSTDKLIAVASGLLLINIKFTGLVYLWVIYGVFGLALLIRHLRTRMPETFATLRYFVINGVAVSIIGIVFMGYNPYVTNTLEHHNPFYPLAGEGKIDVISMQNPPSFNAHNALTRALLSILSKTQNIADKGGTAEPELKLPFTFSQHEVDLYFANDVRMGGWGVLFSGIMLLSLLFFIGSHGWKRKEVLLILSVIFITISINPGSWWARYAPQIALLPLLFIIAEINSPVVWKQRIGNVIYSVSIVNALLILPPNTQFFAFTSQTLQQEIDHAIDKCGKGVYQISDVKGYHFEQFLYQNGIKITYPDKDIRKIHSLDELLPLNNVYLYKQGCKP